MNDTLYVSYILWMMHYANFLINATFHPKVAILEFCWNSRKNAMNDRQVKILICFHPNLIFLFLVLFLFTLMPPLLGSSFFLSILTFYLTMVFSRSVLKWLKSCALRWGATAPGESTLSANLSFLIISVLVVFVNIVAIIIIIHHTPVHPFLRQCIKR